MDDVDVLIKQYAKFLYPVPTDDVERDYLKANKRLMGDPLSCFYQIWPEGRSSLAKLKILSAGCGSSQAAVLAACNPYAEVTGIDISSPAIAYQNLLKQKHALKNLTLIEGDFRDLNHLNTSSYDLIICTGVVHHLADPVTGVAAVRDLLAPNGVAHISVYSKYPRVAMQPFKDAIKKLGANQTDESANFVRRILPQLHLRHPARVFSDTFSDVSENAELIDLYLHNQEQYFSIPEFLRLLESGGLKIKTWAFPERVSLMYTVPELAMKDEYWKLDPIERWHISEIFEHSPYMHQLFATRAGDNLPSIALREFNPNDMYFRFWPGVKFDNNKNTKIELNGKFIEFDVLGFEEVRKNQLKKIGDIPVLKRNPRLVDLLIDAGIFQLSFVPFGKPRLS